jgi:D-alanyl-D-alanine carboxypeptidase
VTLIIAGIVGTLSLLLVALQVEVGKASTDRIRAQIAADASALAAVAESAPYGNSDPSGVARRFARLNGARLTDCLCEPGATSAQVEVTIGDVVARARAVFDPEEVAPDRSSPHGLDPRLAAAVAELVAASRGAIWVVSGFRSPAEQTALWSEALNRFGDAESADDWVARPGTSMHERGLAVDLGGDLTLAERLIAKLELPLHSPLANEPWHFELVGWQANRPVGLG